MSTATGWTHMNVWLELPRKSNWYRMLKGDSSERFEQRTGVGCNRTSRETCRNKFKKEESKLFGRVAKETNLRELADQFGASRFVDLDDPRTFDEALKNVTGIFLITGYTVDML